MALFDLKQDSIGLEQKNSKTNSVPSNKDIILCDHCKRTASNGIRCLGMCVADNDY
tara:strand:+ start:223 stop:390 length:168 start_codon:yes stop_codon:yes gene_type:complete